MRYAGNPPYSIPSYSSVRWRLAEWSLTVLGCGAPECVGRRRERSFLRVLEGEPFAAVVLGPRRELVGQGELKPVEEVPCGAGYATARPPMQIIRSEALAARRPSAHRSMGRRGARGIGPVEHRFNKSPARRHPYQETAPALA